VRKEKRGVSYRFSFQLNRNREREKKNRMLEKLRNQFLYLKLLVYDTRRFGSSPRKDARAGRMQPIAAPKAKHSPACCLDLDVSNQNCFVALRNFTVPLFLVGESQHG
jgi:hypothetical protein